MSINDFSLNDLANELTAKTITSTGTLYNTTTGETSTFTPASTTVTPISTTFSFPLSSLGLKTAEVDMSWAENEIDTVKKEFKKYKDATDKHIDELEADIEYLSDNYKKAVEQLVLMQEAFNQATVKALVVAETMEKIKDIDTIEQAAKEATAFNDRLQTNESLVDYLKSELFNLKQQLNEKEPAYV